jgi:hypothetical protein
MKAKTTAAEATARLGVLIGDRSFCPFIQTSEYFGLQRSLQLDRLYVLARGAVENLISGKSPRSVMVRTCFIGTPNSGK